MRTDSRVTTPASPSVWRSAVSRTIWVWTAATSGLAGLAALAGIVIFAGVDRVDMALVLLAGAAWLVLSGLASQVAAWRLSILLAAPADTLTALDRIGAGERTGGDSEPFTDDVRDLARAFDRLRDRLVRAAHERNGRVSELTRALDAAREMGEARAGFFAGMSHELRTPLNAIIGYAMLLAEDAAEAGDEDAVRDLDRILQSGRRLLGLINDILDLSRMDAGDIVIERSAVDVVALMESVADGLRDESNRSGARVNLAVGQRARVLLGDAVRLRQCLAALTAQALQHNPGREIVIEAVVAEDDASTIRFQLNDDSARLASAVVAATEIQEGDAPRSAMDADTLAATVAQRLAELMGGRLSAEVRADGSGVVIVGVPLNGGAPGEVVAAPDTAVEPALTGLIRDASEPRLVLVIDDDEPTIDLLTRWMRGQGYAVISAMNGAQGLSLARARRPDLIILDIFMPGQSGYEVLAALKADPLLRNTPVIIASSDDNRRLGLEAGAAEVLVKPLSRDRLRNVLDVIGEQVRGDILVVDDDPNVREIVQRYASQAGLSVRVAKDGAEGLELARRQAPGAIVLDLCMPGSDGFQMMEALSADESLCQVPVMVLSQLDLTLAEHHRIREAGHVFHPKWTASPLQIVQNIKTLVAPR